MMAVVRRTPRHLLTALLVLVLSALASGCGSSSSSSPSDSTGLKTENFSGTVPVKGSDFHQFTTTLTGEVDVTLSSVTPAVNMGVGVGTTDGTTCTLLLGASTPSNGVAAGTNAQLAGIVSAGTFCVQIYDVGNLTSAATYSVTVVHPQ
jgi:hypothetical protein